MEDFDTKSKQLIKSCKLLRKERTRLILDKVLANRSLSVSRIQEELDMPEISNMSQILKELYLAGLVDYETKGRQHLYKVNYKRYHWLQSFINNFEPVLIQ